jgi:hypothetical protein
MRRFFNPQFWFVPGSLAFLTFLYYSHGFLAGGTTGFTGRDFREFVYPIHQFVTRILSQEGSLPLWNPHQFLGYSVVGNPQYLLFYPPHWVVWLLGNARVPLGIALVLTLHAFWGGWGMARLAEVFGARRVPALFGGFVFAFGAFPAARIYGGHYTIVLEMSWLPWIMAAYQLSNLRRSTFWAVLGGVALAFQAASGHPQMTYISGLALALHWGYTLLTTETWAERWRCTQRLLLIGVLGFLLSAVALLPIVEFSRMTQRSGEATDEFIDSYSMPADQLATLVVPDLYGNPFDKSAGYWGEPFYEEMTSYTGLLPWLALLLVPLLHRRSAWLFVALLVVGVLLSLGADGGVQLALYRWVPVAGGFRAPARALMLTTLGGSGLVALLLTHLMELTAEECRALLRNMLTRVVPAGVIFLWGAVFLYNAFNASAQATYRIEQFALSGLFLALTGFALWIWTRPNRQNLALVITGAVLLVDVWRISWPLLVAGPIVLESVWREAQVDVPIGAAAGYGRVMQLPPPQGAPNGASSTGHLTTQGYDSLAPLEWIALNRMTDFNPTSPVNRLFGVRYTLSALPIEDYDFEGTENFALVGLRPPYVFYENLDAVPRSFLVHTYEIQVDTERAQTRLANGAFDFTTSALLEKAPDCELSAENLAGELDPQITLYTPNRIEIQAQTNSPGLLILSDQYAPGWQATVNGEAADVLRVDTLLRGVCVPAGNSEIVFTYLPRSLILGGVISALSWAAVLIYSVRKILQSGVQGGTQTAKNIAD